MERISKANGMANGTKANMRIACMAYIKVYKCVDVKFDLTFNQ